MAASLALAGPAAARPSRVASLNLCTDELLLLLAEPDQVASVTHLSQDPAEFPLWRSARRHRANDGSLLSVVPLRPDLVLTMGGGGRDRLRIAGRLGIASLDLPFPSTLTELRAAIERTARVLGRPAAGAALLRRIDALRNRAPRRAMDAIWLGVGGRTVASTGLAAEWMRLAGLRQRVIHGDRVPLELLIASPPEILLISDYRGSQFSLAQRWLGHPAVRHARSGRWIATDGRAWTCLGPLLIGEIERLRGAVAR